MDCSILKQTTQVAWYGSKWSGHVCSLNCSESSLTVHHLLAHPILPKHTLNPKPKRQGMLVIRPRATSQSAASAASYGLSAVSPMRMERRILRCQSGTNRFERTFVTSNCILASMSELPTQLPSLLVVCKDWRNEEL